MNAQPCHQSRCRLDPAIEAHVRALVAARGRPAVCRLLSTSEPTLRELLDVGGGGVRHVTCVRVERYARGLMRAEGLVPPPERDAPARPPAKVREAGNLQLVVKSQNVLTEWEGICAGQVWMVKEPSGREIRVRITHIIRDGYHGARAHGRTPSGRKRAVLADTLRKGMFARLIEHAPTEARSA